ncbi:MAG: hypothetical protein V3T86_14615 [Planctomycetota bacterium]
MKRFALILLVLFLAPAVVDAKKSKKPAPAKPAKSKGPRIWVRAPVQDLLAMFPGKGAGFLISIEEYNDLIRRGETNERRAEARPPLAARIVRGEATAELKNDEFLNITAKYTVVVTSADGASVPFFVRGAALESVSFPDTEAGQLVGDELRFSKPGTFTVDAVMSVRLQPGGGVKRAAFQLPSASGQTVTITLPAEVEGEVGPIVRSFRTTTSDRQAHVVGYPDGAGRLTFWMRPLAPARELDPILSVSFATIAEIAEARTLTRTILDLEVLRAPVSKIEIDLQKGQTVRDLSGKGVKRWTVEERDGMDRLTVTLVEPRQANLRLTLETELPRGNETVTTIPLPRLPAAVRYRGVVGVASHREVRVKNLLATGARRLDHTSGTAKPLAEIPGKASGRAVGLYEVWAQTAEIRAEIERLESKTVARTQLLLSLHEGGKTLLASFFYHVKREDLFRLEPELPAGWILRSVFMDDVQKDHTYKDDGKLLLEFPAGLKPGWHKLTLRLETDEVDWVPNEGQVDFTLAGVRAGIDEETGILAVAADQAFSMNLGEKNGLNDVGMPEVAAAGIPVTDRLLFAWRFDAPGHAVRLELTRNKPEITATVLTRLMPSDDVLSIHATLLLNIERTGVRELKIKLPKGTGDLVDFRGPAIKERRKPDKDATADVWTIVFQKRVRGRYRLDAIWDKKFEEDTWETVVPEIELPDGEDRGFLLIHASTSTAIRVDRNGLREADIGELPEAPAQPPLEILAYAAHPYTVTIESKRHDPTEVLQAVAIQASIYGMLTKEGALRCRAEYRIRNNDQPFLRFGLPAASRLLGVTVDGKPAKPLVEDGELKLPLPRSRGRTTPFVVAIVYESRVRELSAKGKVTIERPALDIDVLRTDYRLHLPRGYEITGADGDLVPLSRAKKTLVLEEIGGLLGDAAEMAGAPMASAEVRFERSARKASSGSYATEVSSKQGIIDQLTNEHKDANDARTALVQQLEDARSESENIKTDLKNRLREKDRRISALDNALHNMRTRRTLAEKSEGKYDDDFDVEEAELEIVDEAVFPGQAEEAPVAMDKSKSVRHELSYEKGLDVAQARPGQTPPPKRVRKGKKRLAKRELLSLDIQFHRSDNVVALRSLARGGSVTLEYIDGDVPDRRAYFGLLIGAAGAVFLLLRKRPRLLRALPGAACLMLALHFGGMSILPEEFALGAAYALFAVVILALLWRVPAILRGFVALVRRIVSRRKATVAGAVLLACTTTARADDEIIAPYEKGSPDEIKQVFLGAAEYHRLRKLANPDEKGRPTAILNADYKVNVTGDQATLSATYQIVKETPDEEYIPLGLDGTALTSALMDGKPAPVLIRKHRYYLVLKGAGSHKLSLVLQPRLGTDGGSTRFKVRVVPVANAKLELKHDLAGHKARVVSLGRNVGELYHIGPVTELSVKLEATTEGFKAPAAELRSFTETFVSVRDGYTGLAARIAYTISGGKTNRLQVRVEKNLIVRSVACPGLAGWSLKDGLLTLALSKPVANRLTVSLFGEIPHEREREESLPEVAPLGVLRDAGLVVLDSLNDLKLRVLDMQGLRRASMNSGARLTGAHTHGTVHSTYRFSTRPVALSWRVSLEASRLRAQSAVDVYLERERVRATVLTSLTLERGPGPFHVAFSVPEAYEVTRVVAPGMRDWWRDGDTLHIARSVRHTGTQKYWIGLLKKGKTESVFSAPAVRSMDATRESGMLRIATVIGRGDGLEVEAFEASNLLPEDADKVAKLRGARLVRAYAYVTTPWSLRLKTAEEPRDIEAIVVNRVVPLEDRLRVESLVHFYVRRGLVDEIVFRVPTQDKIVVNAPDQRQATPSQVNGDTVYRVVLRTPTRGSASVTVTYHVPLNTPVRGVEPMQVSRIRRFVAVEKVADGEVRFGEKSQLESGTFPDLPFVPPQTTTSSVAGVFVGTGGPCKLGVTVKRHAFEEVAPAVVHSAQARVLVDRSGSVRTLMTYRVYNRSEQFLRLRLPEGATLYSAFVAGEGVRPLIEDGAILVPLRKVALGSPTFDVDVVFAYDSAELRAKDLIARVPDVEKLAVRRTTISLYLPKGFRYDFDTDMERVFEAQLEANRATDVYREIKDLYAVAERGNFWQKERALSNVRKLEQEAKGLADKLQSLPASKEQRAQVRAQQGAISKLRASADRQTVTPQQQFKYQSAGKQTDANVVQRWASNESSRVWKDAEAQEQRKDYELKRNVFAPGTRGAVFFSDAIGVGVIDIDPSRQPYATNGLRLEPQPGGPTTPSEDSPFSGPSTNTAVGLSGGAGGGRRRGKFKQPQAAVPPGLREPTDPEARPPPPRKPSTANKKALGRKSRKPGDEGRGRTTSIQGSLVDELKRLDGKQIAELDGVTNGTDDRSIGWDAGKRNRVTMGETIWTGKAGVDHAPELSSAKGRISIRIDLPFDGDMEIHHFAKLSNTGAISVHATEGESTIWAELGTFAFLALGAFCVFFRRG